MKTKEILTKKDDELKQQIIDLSAKLSKMRFDLTTKRLKNHNEIKAAKRDIARMKTVMRERELLAESKKEEAK